MASVGAHRRPKWVSHYGAQADSGSAQVRSPSAQVKAAATQKH
jgi:hypothetical protein